MGDNGNYYNCFKCNKKFKMGPHSYEGNYILRYKIIVCRMCYEGNWDGWVPHFEEKLLGHLEEEGLPIPQRNSRGWLPRD